MALFPHFLPNFVFILVFTVFASTVSGFWPFSFKPPLENPRLWLKVLKAPLLYLGPPLGFLSGGLKENGQNPDTVEAKTVKTKITTQIGQKMGQKCHFVSLL